MVAVQETALEILDRASTPFTSYQAMVTVLAAAVDDDGRTETETGHLHALCAAMLFFRQPDGTFLGTYQGPGPDPWPRQADQLPTEVHGLWSVYADAAAHPMVRARLHHLLWSIRHGERPFRHLQAAISGYRQAVPALLAADGPLAVTDRWQAVEALRDAHSLATATNQPQLADIVTEMVQLADTALGWSEPAPGVVHAMTGRLLTDRRNHTLLRPLLERAADRYRHDPHTHIHFLEDLRRTEPDAATQSLIDERITAAYASHAAQFDGLAKLMWLEKAAAFARDHGLTDALDQIRRAQQRLTPVDLELTRAVTPFQLPTHFIDAARAVIDAATDLDQALRTIATATPVLADPIDAEQHGLIRLPSAHLNLNGPVVTMVSDTDTPVGQSPTDTRILSLDLHGLLVEAQFDQVNERFTPTTDHLHTLLTHPPIAPATRTRGLARALQAFWDRDDDVAIALVLPRIEGMLRRRLHAADVAVIQHAQGDRPGQVSQLGSLITDMEKAGYPEPWPAVFRTLLGGPGDGMNLRNTVLHDLVDTPPRHRIALALQAALTVLFLPIADPANPVDAPPK
ncbi:hypothetical protein [Streptomyces sp. GQFP]|uniref:hypothetical protein n=1 Tax=Streptomyces sp. GQFP TaxID=2907545 RepID=UPI001F1AFB50|nr:hypothetical protein [Streptomyces sp. GQFP]UIX32063.1 hypothetical protein LUX31_19580 [Streptomyces sp. GQFP]